MKFHPILFSTPMVIAIGDGTKTKTRRTKGLEKVNENPNEWNFAGFGTNPDNEQDKRLYAYFTIKNTETWFYVKCPYQVGDVFWVRETFHECETPELKGGFFYKSSIDEGWGLKWKPSIFMPKPAARYFLKIKSIKVERIQQINEADAKAEGAKDTLKYNDFKFFEGLKGWNIPRPFSPHQFGFLFIWCKINGAENWLKNPFVWVYEFEKIEKPDNFI